MGHDPCDDCCNCKSNVDDCCGAFCKTSDLNKCCDCNCQNSCNNCCAGDGCDIDDCCRSARHTCDCCGANASASPCAETAFCCACPCLFVANEAAPGLLCGCIACGGMLDQDCASWCFCLTLCLLPFAIVGAVLMVMDSTDKDEWSPLSIAIIAVAVICMLCVLWMFCALLSRKHYRRKHHKGCKGVVMIAQPGQPVAVTQPYAGAGGYAQPAYVAQPQPVVYAQQPVMYAQPQPVMYQQQPAMYGAPQQQVMYGQRPY